MRCAGLLLTGGLSRRLGEDKAAVRMAPGGPTIAETRAHILLAESAPVLEVGPGWSGLPTVAEPDGPRGPLVALAHGWRALEADHHIVGGVVVLACDMPLVSHVLVRWLVEHPAPGSVIPVAGASRRPQPLCARWATADLVGLPDLVGAGERSLRALLDASEVTYASVEEWLPHAGRAAHHAFDDVDTPAALSRLRERISRAEP